MLKRVIYYAEKLDDTGNVVKELPSQNEDDGFYDEELEKALLEPVMEERSGYIHSVHTVSFDQAAGDRMVRVYNTIAVIIDESTKRMVETPIEQVIFNDTLY